MRRKNQGVEAVEVARALAVIAIVLVGAALRVTGIGFGDPFVYHPDEWIIARPGMTMAATGDWNPHNFSYPSLLIDLEALVASFLHAAGGASLATGQPWLYENELVADQFVYVLAGRLLVATLGIATILVVFETTRRLVGVGGALAAAVIVAVVPLAVEHSHYLTTDVPMAFLCAACLLATVVASQDGRARWWLVAAVLAGLAGSTKWNGLAVAVVPFVAYVATHFDPTHPRAIIRDPLPYTMAAATLVGFIVPTPAILLAPADVNSFLAFSAGLYAIPDPRQTQDTIMFNVDTLIATLGPLVVWCGVGVVLLIAWFGRDASERGAVAIPVFLLVYFVLAALPARYYARNLLPIIPFAAVAGGVAVATFVERLGRRGESRGPASRSGAAIVVLVFIISLAPSAVSSLAFTSNLLRPDTRDIARAWMLEHVPRGAVVAREIYTPQFDGQEFTPAGSFFLPQIDLDGYRAKGTRYLIASSWAYERFVDKPGAPTEDAFYRELFALAEVLRVDAGPGRSGPTIRIFHLDR